MKLLFRHSLQFSVITWSRELWAFIFPMKSSHDLFIPPRFITIRSPSWSCKNSHDRFELLRHGSPSSQKLEDQQWPLLALFHIWSLDFWVYSYLPQKFLICNYILFKLNPHFLIVHTIPSMITRTNPWTSGSFLLDF